MNTLNKKKYKMKAICGLILVFLTVNSYSQNEDFNIIIMNPATNVKNQMGSGQYCWSYATCSFLESELIRSGKSVYDLSEDYFIYHAYIDKAENYVLRKGYARFYKGGLAHDVLRIVKEKGAIPDPFYKIDYIRNNNEPEDVLFSYLNTILKEEYLTENWMKHYLALLDSYFADRIDQFKLNDSAFTPKTFVKYIGINVDDYVSITSFTHHPFNTNFILEIPDNYANGSYFNIPLNDFIQIVDTCLIKGYTLVWDGCIEGRGFSYNDGLAMEPVYSNYKDLVLEPDINEHDIDQQKRQIAFERLQTTDDHLMHIIGIAESVKGKKFYIVKDSGGEYGPYNGYLYMSEAFFKMKTLAITLNKNAIPESIKIMMSEK